MSPELRVVESDWSSWIGWQVEPAHALWPSDTFGTESETPHKYRARGTGDKSQVRH